MTPSQYKGRYEHLVVALENGEATVRVNQYRLRSRNYNAAASSAFLGELRKRGIDTELRIHTEAGVVHVDPDLRKKEDELKRKTGIEMELSFDDASFRKVRVSTRVADWNLMARYTFAGKGAPEHCQVVLQLARAWGLASDLQAYADACLGLDCNGFVGNYLWHVKARRPWTSLGVGNLDVGPDAWITGYFRKKKFVQSWEAIDTSKSYLLGLVDKSGNIIPGGPGSPIGHIVITEPNRRAERPGKNGSFAVRAVESTGGHSPGLWESWYSCVSVRKGVFAIDREEIRGARYASFKIAALD